jgi:hypothetical protein
MQFRFFCFLLPTAENQEASGMWRVSRLQGLKPPLHPAVAVPHPKALRAGRRGIFASHAMRAAAHRGAMARSASHPAPHDDSSPLRSVHMGASRRTAGMDDGWLRSVRGCYSLRSYATPTEMAHRLGALRYGLRPTAGPRYSGSAASPSFAVHLSERQVVAYLTYPEGVSAAPSGR